MQKFSDNKNLTVIYISHEKDFSNYFDNQNIINFKMRNIIKNLFYFIRL